MGGNGDQLTCRWECVRSSTEPGAPTNGRHCATGASPDRWCEFVKGRLPLWFGSLGRSDAQPSPVGPALEKEGAAVGETLRRKYGRRARLGRASQ